jgi:PEP-CTERM motif
MKSVRSIMMTAAAATALAAAGSAKAAITYKYTTYTGGTAVTSYNATAGVPITIPIYLYEQLTNSSSSLITSDEGMFSACFSVTQTTNTGAGTLTGSAGSVSSNGSNFSAGGGFANSSGKDSSLYQGIANALGNSASSGPVPNASGDIQIGSVTITPTVTTTYVLGAENYPATKSADLTTTFTNGYDLDANSTSPAYTGAIANPETFSVVVAPVPEPASAAVLGIGALGLLTRRRRTA